MSHPGIVYRFLLQPNPNRTISEPGTIEFMISLTPNQRQGLATMAEALFVDRHNEFTIESGLHIRVLVLNLPNGPHTFDEFGPLQHPYISFMTVARFHRLWNHRIPWTQAIRDPDLVRTSRSRQALNRPLDPYTAVLHSYRDRDDGYIVEFRDPEFLQGAITMCQWLGLDWRQYITDIHESDQLMEVTNV